MAQDRITLDDLLAPAKPSRGGLTLDDLMTPATKSPLSRMAERPPIDRFPSLLDVIESAPNDPGPNASAAARARYEDEMSRLREAQRQEDRDRGRYEANRIAREDVERAQVAVAAEARSGPAPISANASPEEVEQHRLATERFNSPEGQQESGRLLAEDATKQESWADINRKFWEKIVPGFQTGIGGVVQSIYENPTMGNPAAQIGTKAGEYLVGLATGRDVAAEKEAYFAAMRKQGSIPGQALYESGMRDLVANANDPDNTGFKKYVPMVADSVVQMLPAIAMAYATKNPNVGALALAPQVYGQQYGESRDAGRSPEASQIDATFMAAAEVIGEKIPLGMMMQPGGQFLKDTLKTAGAEGVQEMFTQVLQTGYDKGVLKPEMTWGEAFEQIRDAGIVGLALGGTLGAATYPLRQGEQAQPVVPPVQTDLPFAPQPSDPSVKLPRVAPPGIVETAQAAAPPLTPEDEASPLPNDLIAEGKRTAAAAPAQGDANQILSDNAAPAIGTRVVVEVGGKSMIGTVTDAFVDTSDAELGPQAGISIDLDSGGKMREFFNDMRDAGAQVRPLDKVLEPPEQSKSVPAEPVQAAPAGEPTNDQLKPIFRAKESGGSDTAKNELSSASGRYQFTKGTWEGLGGDWSNRFDAAEQERLMGKLLDQNRAALKSNGLVADAGNMYAAHVFGAGGVAAMTVNPGAPVAAEVQQANPHLRGKTNGEALAWARGAAGDVAAPVAPTEEPDLLRQPLSTAQVEVPSINGSTLDEQPRLPDRSTIAAAASPPQITDTPSGKGIAISGLSEAQRSAISQAVPKARSIPNMDGSEVYAKRWEPAIREALSSVEKSAVETVAGDLIGDGTRQAPARVTHVEHLDAIAPQVAQPTEAQAAAGNYKKNHIKLQGLDITIETPKGAERRGVDPDGQPWSVTMPSSYGYVKRTTGADGEQVDVYVGPQPQSQRVYMIDQVDADTKGYDEHKIMLGFETREEAVAAYDAAFSDGRGPERRADVIETTTEGFKKWLADSDTTKPAAQTVVAIEAPTSESEVGLEPFRSASPVAVTQDESPTAAPVYVARGLSDKEATTIRAEAPGRDIVLDPDAGGKRLFAVTEAPATPEASAPRMEWSEAYEMGQRRSPHPEKTDRRGYWAAGFADAKAGKEAALPSSAPGAKFAPRKGQEDLYDAYVEGRIEAGDANVAPRAPKQAALKAKMGSVTPPITFTTAKGSVYRVEADGTTTRDKAARPEHPGDQGLKPRSERTVFVDPDQVGLLAPVQAKTGGKTKLVFDEDTENVAVSYVDGPEAGKLLRGTVVPMKRAPAVGLVPIETWDDGRNVHFGNAITEIQEGGGTDIAPRSESGGADAVPQAAPAPISKQDALKTWGSPDFKTAIKAIGEPPHRESSVAASMIDGWQQGQAGDVAALRAHLEQQGDSIASILGSPQKGQNGFNPRNGYVETFYAAVTGKTVQIRSVQTEDSLGVAEAVSEIKNMLGTGRPSAKLESLAIPPAKPELGPTFADPQGDMAQSGVLRAVVEERGAALPYGPRNWLLRNGLAQAAKRGKGIVITQDGTAQLARLDEATGRAEQDRARGEMRAGVPSQSEEIGDVAPGPSNATRPQPITVSKNKIFTDEAAEKARAVLRAKLNPNRLNSGVDPEIIQAGLTLAGYHVEKGARTFAAYSKAMVDDLGETARPYLRSWYEAARHYPGMESVAREMSRGEEIDAEVTANENRATPRAETDDGVQGSVPAGDARAGTEDVQRASEDRSTRRAPDSEDQGSARPVRPARSERTEGNERAGPQLEPAARDRAGSVRDPDRVPEREPAGGRGRRENPAADVTGQNWHIKPGSLDEGRGAAAKARDNLRAVEIVKELDESGAPATREQQTALARYVGWGGLKNAFNETDGSFPKGFETIGPKLKELLTPEEYDTARRSIQYAHYTSENIIGPMWQAVERMGFKGGRVFEPGMGTGNFLGLMPPELAAATQYSGLEFDYVTARIAQLLYPQAGIRHGDFTEGHLPKDAYDLVIGNPPFSSTVVRSDPEYGKLGFVLHDFFFAKSLDAVRPGGLLVFITSAGTMNKVGTEARAWLADRADLVGAVRLPGGAFRENAGTDVTTDIIVLKKRAAGEKPGDRTWIETVEAMLPTRGGGTSKEQVSRYFREHPEQVLGEEEIGDTLTPTARYSVRPREGQNLGKELRDALDRIARGAIITERTSSAVADFDTETTERKEGSFYLGKDGRLMQYRAGAGSPVEGRGKGVKGGYSAAELERIRALVPIRDALRSVLSHDLAGRTAEADAARAKLNSVYDRFVQQYGPINKAEIRYQRPSVIQQESARAAAREEVRLAGGFFNEGSFAPDDPNARLSELAPARKEAREAAQALGREFDEGDFDPADMPDLVIVKRPNIDPFMDDQEGYRLRSIEHFNDDTGEAKKGDIFRENVVTKERPPEIRSSNDALLFVLNRFGRPDIDQIAQLANKSRSEVLEDLASAVFKVPEAGETYQTREQYLSGNVRAKLELARAAAERDPDFRRNVAALEAVQPAALGPADIAVNLGMPWVPPDVVEAFATSLGLQQAKVTYRRKLAQWSITGNRYSAAASSQWGTPRRDAFELLNAALNRQDPKVFDTVRGPDNRDVQVLNAVDTQAAQDKVRELRAKFNEWVWEDAARSDRLTTLYNTEYNNLVAPVYDGSYLTTPGIAASWSWRPHQTRVIARIIQSGNTYMAHAVGAGKTSAMIGAGMEMRRLGLVRKPMYAVPNHMLGQFTKEFYEQYPTAKIMVADERQFHTDRRKQFVANMASEDLDAVIITHSAFGFIPISDAFSARLLSEQISEFRSLLNELKAERSGDPGQRITQRRIEQQIEAMEQKLKGRQKRADQVFNFEETGVDFLFIDEAHLFRKLDYATRMSSVRGIDPNGSQMAYDLFAKTRYLEEQAPGRSHVLASGTPVTNTMAELFSLQRYQQTRELESRGLQQFDAWAGAFGETVTALEQDPAGGYKPQTRFARFVNVPELSAMVRQVMDVVTSRELEKYVVRPKLKGGKRQMRVTQPSAALLDYQETLAARMKAIQKRSGKPQKGDDILLSVIGDGRKAAIDMRLVDPTLREEDKSKLEDLIDNVARIAEETKSKGFHRPEGDGYAAKPAFTGPATQMVFSDLGLNGEFAVHRYIRAQLIARGLKDSQVAIISDYKTSVARQRLFNDMNEGKVRVLIGSVPKMGTGVNAQRRLYAIHNLDPQWYPANDEQRNGRALRQGNMNPEIEIVDYSTKGTYDSTMWGLMETKARFIEGFFNGDPTLRSMDDLGEASQYEQAKAITTADPRILELTQHRQDLERALLRRAGFEREIFATRDRIRSAEDTIERMEALIPHLEADLAQRQDLGGDSFTAQVGNETFTDRAEFGEAIIDRMNDLVGGGLSLRDRKIGEISGFTLTVDVMNMGSRGNATLYLNRNGNRQERVKAETPAGIATSATAILRGFEQDISDARARITSSERTIEEYTPQANKRFEGMGEINELQGKVDEIESVLTREANERAGMKPVEKASRLPSPEPEGKPVDWSAVQTALRKELVSAGLADRVTLEAGFNLFKDPRQLGSTQGERIRVALEADDPVFVLRHEIIHRMRDLGLFTSEEWRQLARYVADTPSLMADVNEAYPELSADQRIEEAVSQAYSLWQRDREQAPKGFVQRAMRRLHGFLTSLWRVTRGESNAYQRIFNDVAEGRVGARETLDESPDGSVEHRSIMGSVVAAPDPKTVSEIMTRARDLRGRLAEGYDDWRVALQDRMLPVLRAENAAARALGRELVDAERPYLAEELMTGRVGAKIDVLADQLVEPMFEAMKAEGITADELESFLYARHASERNAHIASINPDFAEGTGSGMTDIEAAAILRRIDKAGRTKEFERVAERVDAILAFALAERVDAGLMSESQTDEWRNAYDHYVPLRGFAELDGADERANMGGGGITVRGPESKRAFGRRSKADDIIAHTIMQAEEAIVRGEKNRVARAFYDLAKAAPDPDFWQTNKVTMRRRANRETGLVETYPATQMIGEDAQWTVSLKIDGKERRVTLNRHNSAARRVAEAMRRLDEQKTAGILVMLSKVNRYLSTVNTSLNPNFIVTNAFRDFQTALVNAAGIELKGFQKAIARDYRKALFAATRGAFGKETGDWGKWWREYTDEGGRVSYNQMQDMETLRRDIEQRLRPAPTGTSPKELGLRAWGQIKAFYGVIDKVNTGVENAVRLSAYKNARELGATKPQAASIAKNLTVNFNRRGTHGVLMNALYLFYNASTQGSARILIGMKSQNVRRIVYGIVIAGALQELINTMISPDDDDGEPLYDKVPEFEKSRNMVLMVGGPWGDHLKLPMPWGYNAFHSLGRNIASALLGKGTGPALGNIAKSFVDAFNPIGGTNSILNFVSPTLIDPAVDLYTNRDFAGRPIKPDQNPFEPPTPENQRYWGSVNPVWKAITDALNTGSGGDAVVPGAVDVSPETLEYLFGTATGGAGQFVERTGGTVIKLTDGDPETEFSVNDLPLVSKVAGKKPAWYDKAAFYARLGQVEQFVERAKDYAQRGDDKGFDRYLEANGDLRDMVGEAKAARRAMRQVRKARSSYELAREIGEIDVTTYRESLAPVKEAEDEIIRTFNAAYIKVVKPPLRP